MATLAVLLPGCFESHGLGERPDAGGRDARTRSDARPRPDSGPPIVDAGPPPRLCRISGPARIDGDPPVPRPAALGFSVTNLRGADVCPTTFTFLLLPAEVVDPFDLPVPRIELEATVEENLLGEPFVGSVEGVARAFDVGGAMVDETDATMRIEAVPIDFGPGGRIEGEASVSFGVPAWSAMGNAEAPYCRASICL